MIVSPFPAALKTARKRREPFETILQSLLAQARTMAARRRAKWTTLVV